MNDERDKRDSSRDDERDKSDSKAGQSRARSTATQQQQFKCPNLDQGGGSFSQLLKLFRQLLVSQGSHVCCNALCLVATPVALYDDGTAVTG
jgi:hypothetical protein